ncbi:hypothetical protein [Acinetobacter sp. ANC 4862]|uniref:hypothetical protein n=1 Tax=Acinetobacter sp. ANC 4862 TaxID=2529849 RepID=UPI0013F3A3BD|nr:hypothetical protein [Acinetobacter sp. ANC 4862]
MAKTQLLNVYATSHAGTKVGLAISAMNYFGKNWLIKTSLKPSERAEPERIQEIKGCSTAALDEKSAE